MTTWQGVVFWHKAHPEWCAAEIADMLGCSSAYVRATGQRRDLRLPKGKCGRSLLPAVQSRNALIVILAQTGLYTRHDLAKKFKLRVAYIAVILYKARAKGARIPYLPLAPREVA